MTTCPRCGHETGSGFRFCSACGAEVGPPAREERRTVTVVFCDLAGSTALGESVDPERLRRILAAYFERMKGIVESHGGTVEKFIGDAVMAVFGVPVVHEDDALRAVRAAAEMRDALPELSLAGRLGVMTGEVVTGTEERLVTGDAVNVAARLESSAAPGEILVGEPTLALVRDAVETEALEPLELKGKTDRVLAFRLLRVHDAPERRHDTPFVGRERELGALCDAYEAAKHEQRCVLVTIVGDPGVGKSRLAAETLASIDARVVSARCLPYGEGITYWPVVEVLMQLDGRPSDERAAAAIGSLLGEDEALMSAEEIAWAFRKTLEHAATERPLVVVFDDIQWGEETFLDLVEHVALLSIGEPILILCMARPELVERRPDWQVTIRLDRLTASDVDSLLPRGLPGELRERIARAAGGNPLFVHEMIGMALTSDGEVVVPPTLQALLAARLDQLETGERTVLERASVEGEVFHRGSVQALEPGADRVTPRLATLVRKQLIEPHTPVYPGEDGFRFRHLLIRDAAYDALTKATRAELHERFATWLEEHGTSLVELDELLGYHLEQACAYRRELGENGEVGGARSARASRHLAAAGRRAIERQDYRAAVNLLGRAALVLPDDGCDPSLEVDLGWSRFQAGEGSERVLSGFLDAAERAARAGDEAGALGLRVDHAGYELVYEGSSAAADRALALADGARPVFEASGDDWGLSLVYTTMLLAQETHAKPWADILATAERIVTHARRAGAEMIARFGEHNCVNAQQEGATPVSECLRWLDEHPHLERQSALPLRSRLLAMLGRFDEARELQARSAERLAELGSVRGPLILALRRYHVSMLEGDYGSAEAAAREMCERALTAGELSSFVEFSPMLALALLELDRDEEADEWLERAHAASSTGAVTPRVLWRQAKAKVLARRGAHAEAEHLAREAVAIGDDGDALNLQADAYVDLAEVLTLGDKREEAAAALAEALDRYERKGNVVMAERTRKRLGEDGTSR